MQAASGPRSLGSGAASRRFMPRRVVSGDTCIALSGQSGFGKSTVATSLSSMGFAFHADDHCLAQARDGRFVAATSPLGIWR